MLAARARLIVYVMVSTLAVLAPSPVSTTRFQQDSSGRIVVAVRVDGTPQLFVLDTAAPHTTISASSAAALRQKIRDVRPGLRTVEDVSLELLGVVLPHQSIRLLDADPDSPQNVLGAELCGRFIVKVDFHARRITLWPPSATIDVRRATVVAADFSSGAPVIRATVGAAGVADSAATLAVGLASAPGTLAPTYRYGAESGLLDASRHGELAIELRGIARTPLPATARLLAEPERAPLLFADGILSARVLTKSWIVFDAPHRRIVLGD